ncbi:hypothetical protein HU200_033060 [Digitaria exilis]|uniref:Uncharacterized protein n=1 Tax=Digitaria exilis TaxID=1010633 RepID=A0A835ENV0_9POAL|nr:hypothetical protein HU200_033060 [Digitaria exilis]
MPLGTIVRLLGKQSQMGYLDEVYNSVEDLSSDYFQTKACKAMLLKPLNAASSHCHRLKINIDDTKPREVYVCKDTSCYAHCAFSSVPDTLCKCGKVMEYAGDRPENDAKTAAAGSDNGVFVIGSQKFITTDDLQIGNVKIKVLQTRINSAVLYAEVGHDFVDLVFGLLSVPLGCVTKALSQRLSKGCIDNLYRSIAGSAEGCMGPDYKRMLLAPELAPFFGSGASQILEAAESAPKKIKVDSRFSCFKIGGFSNLGRCREQAYRYNSSYGCNRHEFTYCQNTTKTAEICELDPKLHGVQNSNCDAYVKQGPQSFMVTDDLHVRPLTLDSSLRVVSEGKVQMKDLVEKEVALTKLQIMELQRAALMTCEALSSVLLPPKKKKKNLKHLMY